MDTRFLGKKCPFCKTPFSDDDVIVVCSVCEMPHHLSCWQENKGCTTFGCTGIIREIIGDPGFDSPEPSDKQETAGPVSSQTGRPANRFETIFEREPHAIQGKVPVMVEKLSLIEDRQNGSLMARCMFRCLTDKPITAMHVDLVCKDMWGGQVCLVEDFRLTDLKTKRESSFGQTEPIPVPEKATRAFEVLIKKVLYADGTEAVPDPQAYTLPKQETLASFLGNEELAKEYARETNERAKYTPVKGEHFWRCACGGINANEESGCYRCGADRQQLFGLLDAERLASNLDAFREETRLREEREQAEREEARRLEEERLRLEQEERERLQREAEAQKAEERLRKKARRKKTVKRICLSSAAVLLTAFLLYAAVWHVIPYVRYQNACKAAQSHAYDEAYETFVSLGTFSDSSDKAIDTLYQKAVYLRENGSFAEAAKVFESIPDYQDSAAQAVSCRNEAAYLEAQALLDAGSYEEAAEAFSALADYKDSADQATASGYLHAQKLLEEGEYEKARAAFLALADYEDSKDLAKEAEYQFAIERFDAGDYETALEAFKEVKDYKDVPSRLPEAKYRCALALADKKEWNKASSLFKELGDYQDSAAKYQETYYQYGLQLLGSKSYSEAITVFKSLGEYQQSQDKLIEAKYGYVLAHKSRTDSATYSYLNELVAIKYQDSQEIYDTLYAWHVQLVFNDSETDSTTNRSSISKFKKVYCHVILSGGPPNGKVGLRYSYNWPNSGSNGDSWDGEWSDGDSGWFCTWYTYPAYAASGTFKARIYDKSNGQLLAEGSVTITN